MSPWWKKSTFSPELHHQQNPSFEILFTPFFQKILMKNILQLLPPLNWLWNFILHIKFPFFSPVTPLCIFFMVFQSAFIHPFIVPQRSPIPQTPFILFQCGRWRGGGGMKKAKRVEINVKRKWAENEIEEEMQSGWGCCWANWWWIYLMCIF